VLIFAKGRASARNSAGADLTKDGISEACYQSAGHGRLVLPAPYLTQAAP